MPATVTMTEEGILKPGSSTAGISQMYKAAKLLDPARVTALKVARVGTLFPPDCYNNENPKRITMLADEHPADFVAKVENAALADIDLPADLHDDFILSIYVPSRRTIAFAYAILHPSVNDKYYKACEMARVGYDFVDRMHADMNIMRFLSNFWRERVTAMSGMAYIFASKHSRRGSAPHLKLLAEMTGVVTPEPRHGSTEINITMPTPHTIKNITPPKGHKALPDPDEFDTEPA